MDTARQARSRGFLSHSSPAAGLCGKFWALGSVANPSLLPLSVSALLCRESSLFHPLGLWQTQHRDRGTGIPHKHNHHPNKVSSLFFPRV